LVEDEPSIREYREAKVQNLLAVDNNVQRNAVLDVVQKELNDIKKGFNKLQASGRATLLNWHHSYYRCMKGLTRCAGKIRISWPRVSKRRTG
jgi:hypothetical protein